MTEIDYDSLIPNNVDLASDARLKRALEEWHPQFIEWWKDMGPDGFQAAQVYLRTAVSVERSGWALGLPMRARNCILSVSLRALSSTTRAAVQDRARKHRMANGRTAYGLVHERTRWDV